MRSGVGVAAAVAAGLFLAGLEPWRGPRVELVALAVVLLLSLGVFAARSDTRRWLHLASGTLAALLFVFEARAWVVSLLASVAMLSSIALLPAWRGVPRDGRRLSREAALFVAPTVGIVALTFAAAMATGTTRTLLDTVRTALPVAPEAWLAGLCARALGAVLLADGLREDRRPAPGISWLVGAAAVGAIVVRAAFIASVASLPAEVGWSEGPFLVNALKLDAGEPLYGPPADLDSYTYSPLIDLLHHALLAPFGLELSLYASRAVVLVEQLAAAAVLAFCSGALRKKSRYWAVAPIVLACFASSISPAVHPDHGVLLCVAVALALVSGRANGWAFWAGLLLVTPVALSFKLSGGGIGLGLGAVFLLERRFRAVLALAVSAVLCAATIPLFDATLGAFTEYAIGLQRTSKIVWAALPDAALSPFGLAAAVAAAVVLGDRMISGRATSAATSRCAILSLGVACAALPAYAKYTGRDNNLTTILVCAIFIIVRVALDHAERPGPRLHPALLPLTALSLALLARPLAPPIDARAREAARADVAAMVAALRDDAAARRRTLPLVDTVAWIEAGRRDVPHDRLLSALELWLAGRPEAENLVSHLDDGSYDTVIAPGEQLRDQTGPRGAYDARVLRALERGYGVVYPPGEPLPAAVEGAVIFRRHWTRESRRE